MKVVNLNGGATVEKLSACKSRGIARPGGAILGTQVGGGANELCCTMWVLWLQLQSLCHVWCCGCCLCTMYGVTGAIVAPHVVSWL